MAEYEKNKNRFSFQLNENLDNKSAEKKNDSVEKR